MTKGTMRIAVGQVFQESHDFNPVHTQLADFVIERGREAITKNMNAGSTFGGILRRLADAGVEMCATLAARARPGGALTRSAYEAIKHEILEALTAQLPLDGVVFELHGAMTACDLGSTEADLVPAIRSVIGPDAVLAIGIDLHACITEELLGAADIVTACKEHPHSDVVDAGDRAARLALDMLAGRIKPVSAMAAIPLLLRGGYETSQYPMRELHDMAREALKRAPRRLLDVSICNVNPFLDVAGMGQAFIAIADNDPQLAADVVRHLAIECWIRRDQFRDDFLDIEAALETIESHPDKKPYVLSDYGDRVLAGAPGDSIEVLRSLVNSGRNLACAIPVTDPEAVQKAIAAGVGAQVKIEVGGKSTPYLRPMVVEGTIVHLSNGDFVQRGPYQAGQRTTLGPTAVIRARRNYVVATSVAGMTQDPVAFTSQGIDIGNLDFVVTKSGNHFKLNFEGIAEPLVALTPGLSVYKPGVFPFRNAQIYPDHVLPDPKFTVSCFPPGSMNPLTVTLPTRER